MKDFVRFIDDDCVVAECRSGFITVVIEGYDTLHRCPRCDRYRRTGPMFLKVYNGEGLTIYDPIEMIRRREERKEIWLEGKRHKFPTVFTGTNSIEGREDG